jgi:AmiR/NasT family two-component response regulator
VTAERWQAALTNSPVIGVAQGVLMERFGLTADEALESLWRMSQADPVKALEVARALVNSTR